MRKTTVVVIDAEGRDRGKRFFLREASAAAAERWATRATLALARSGVNLPDNVEGAGWAGLAVLGFQALSRANFEDIQPLLDEMWQCVAYVPDARHPEITRPVMWGDPVTGEGSDVEEVATIFRLRMEVFSLHSGFSIPGVSSTSSTPTSSTSGASESTSTSPPRTVAPSRQSSRPGRRR